MDRSVRAITGTVLILAGLLVFGICGLEIIKPGRTDRGWLVSRMLLGLIPMVGGGIVLYRLRPSQNAYLRSIFFQMLESGQMEMTVLQFAMKARIDGDVAKAYLDDRAREYEATFNVGTEGQVFYCFTHALPGD
jgi:uncharacterized membrane protein SirB2